MKKNSTFIISLFLITTALFAQKEDGKREKLQALKIAHLTQKLDLSPKEAEVFWPVYNAFDAEMHAIRKEKRQFRKHADIGTMDEKAIRQFTDRTIALKQKELDLAKAYHEKFKQVLPIKKVALLYIAQETFKRDLLQKMRNHPGHKP